MFIIKKHIKFYLIYILFLAISQSFAAQTVEEAVHLLESGRVSEALPLLEKKVKKRDPAALFALGYHYLNHKEDATPAQRQQAWQWVHQSAQAFFAPALTFLAGEYLNGDELANDEAKAAHLYGVAADLGYGPAQFNYGILLRDGQGIAQDLVEAFYYLAMAALNSRDLELLTENAASHRNEIYQKLSPEQRKEGYALMGQPSVLRAEKRERLLGETLLK